MSSEHACCSGHDHDHEHATPTKALLFRIVLAVSCALVAEIGVWLGWSLWLTAPLAVLAIGLTGAVLLGEWPEAAMVMSLFALAEYIEGRSLDRARHAIDRLLSLAPEDVEVFTADGQWQRLPAAQVESGSLVKVLPGGRIGLDGVVEQGQSSVNQAPITGESLPIEKQVGDTLYAGTINGLSELLYRTQGRYDDSLLARIAVSVQQAQNSKAPVQRFVDRFSRIYTPIVTLLAVAVALFGPLLFGGGWFEWVYKALVLLVIACPCALVISTPVAVVSALTTAARAGLLVKGGVYLERARQLDYLAVDKTGTITAGMPTLQGQWVARNSNALAVARALASRSDHPASVALAQSALSTTPLSTEPTAFEAIAGAGVQAEIAAHTWRLGKYNWVTEHPLAHYPECATWQQQWQAKGASFVFLAQDGELVAAFAVADHIKEGVPEVVQQLQQHGVHIEMLSGDNRHAAQHVAEQVAIPHVQAELLPADKLRIIRERTTQYRCSGMVGDGINDAPALAHADIGFAMGALGSDMAIDTADIAIMNDELASISYTMRLSTRLHHILVQNISTAIAIKLLFLLMTLIGTATMWMAVFADVGASLLVIINSLRLLKDQ